MSKRNKSGHYSQYSSKSNSRSSPSRKNPTVITKRQSEEQDLSYSPQEKYDLQLLNASYKYEQEPVSPELASRFRNNPQLQDALRGPISNLPFSQHLNIELLTNSSATSHISEDEEDEEELEDDVSIIESEEEGYAVKFAGLNNLSVEQLEMVSNAINKIINQKAMTRSLRPSSNSIPYSDPTTLANKKTKKSRSSKNTSSGNNMYDNISSPSTTVTSRQHSTTNSTTDTFSEVDDADMSSSSTTSSSQHFKPFLAPEVNCLLKGQNPVHQQTKTTKRRKHRRTKSGSHMMLTHMEGEVEGVLPIPYLERNPTLEDCEVMSLTESESKASELTAPSHFSQEGGVIIPPMPSSNNQMSSLPQESPANRLHESGVAIPDDKMFVSSIRQQKQQQKPPPHGRGGNSRYLTSTSSSTTPSSTSSTTNEHVASTLVIEGTSSTSKRKSEIVEVGGGGGGGNDMNLFPKKKIVYPPPLSSTSSTIANSQLFVDTDMANEGSYNQQDLGHFTSQKSPHSYVPKNTIDAPEASSLEALLERCGGVMGTLSLAREISSPQSAFIDFGEDSIEEPTL